MVSAPGESCWRPTLIDLARRLLVSGLHEDALSNSFFPFRLLSSTNFFHRDELFIQASKRCNRLQSQSLVSHRFDGRSEAFQPPPNAWTTRSAAAMRSPGVCIA